MNEVENKNQGGRPTMYDKDLHPKLVLKYSLLGLTNLQMAGVLGISEQTFYNWQNEHPEFIESIKKGKVEADANVASMLYKKAIGYKEKRIIPIKLKDTVNGEGAKERVELIEVEDYYPPDAASQFFWLKNRQPDQWRDKKEVDLKDERRSVPVESWLNANTTEEDDENKSAETL